MTGDVPAPAEAIGPAQLAHSAEGLVSILMKRADVETVQGVVTDLETADGALEVSIAGEPVRVLGKPIETLEVGDGVYVRRLSGYAWAASLYERFAYRGDVPETNRLHYVPRVRSTLQVVVPANASGHIGYLSVDYPSYVAGWTVIAESSTSVTYDVLVGPELVPGTRPVFASICAGDFPRLTGQSYAQDTTLANWTQLLAQRSFLEVRCTTAGAQATLTLTLERL